MRFGGIGVAFFWGVGKRRGSTWVVFGSRFAGSWRIPGRVPAAPIRLAAMMDISSALSGSVHGRQRASGDRFLARCHAGNTICTDGQPPDCAGQRPDFQDPASSVVVIMGVFARVVIGRMWRHHHGFVIMGVVAARWRRTPPDASVAPCPANGQVGADPWHLGGVWVAFQLA